MYEIKVTSTVELLNQQKINEMIDRCFDNFGIERLTLQTLSDIREKIKHYLSKIDFNLVTKENLQQLKSCLKKSLERKINFNQTNCQKSLESLRTLLHPLLPFEPKIDSMSQIDYRIASLISLIFDSKSPDTELNQTQPFRA